MDHHHQEHTDNERVAVPETVAAARPPQGQLRLSLPQDTIPALLEVQVQKFGERTLLILESDDDDDNVEITYSQFRTRALSVAARLQHIIQ